MVPSIWRGYSASWCMILDMTKYRVVGPFAVFDVAPGGIVDGGLIDDVDWMLAACAIAEIIEEPQDNGDTQNGKDSLKKR